MKNAFLVLLCASGFAHAKATLPGDAAQGEHLHAAHCVSCHDAKAYTRPDHKVTSIDGLREQMSMCGHATKQDFTAAQKQDLVKYLNEKFYRF